LSISEEEKSVWNEAEKKLRILGYKITLEEFDSLFAGFADLIADYELFKDKVLVVIHEAIEAEEAKRFMGEWVLPRDLPMSIGLKIHLKAERLAPIEHRVFELLKKRRRET